MGIGTKLATELITTIVPLFWLSIVGKKGIREKEFKEIDTKIVSMSILTSLQGINWFCLFDDSEIDARLYLDTSMELLINSLKRNDNEQ